MNITTPGKLLFQSVVPEEYHDRLESLDKRKLGDLLSEIAKKDPKGYPDLLHNIMKVAGNAATTYGGVASVSLDDFKMSDELNALRAKHRLEVYNISQNASLTDEQRRSAVVKYLLPEMDKVQGLLKKMNPSNNSFISQLSTGARGNPAQVMQLLYGDMLVVDNDGNPIPVAGLTGYGDGVTPAQYWAAAYGSRLGYAQVQFGTADSGYFGKLLTQAAQRVVVTEDDCGVSGDVSQATTADEHVIGTILSRAVGRIPAGTVITREHLPLMSGEDIYTRSVNTCQAKEGVCSKCAGIREKGTFPAIGEAIGVSASRALAEPVTQLALSSKHSGGVAGQDDAKVTGFKEISQFVNVPSNFRGGATLTETDGRVVSITKAPQGGSYVLVGDTNYYVPAKVPVTVKLGDVVEAGDSLSEGIPNPAIIVKYKGIGEGRRYFTKQFEDILEKNGGSNHRRNIEDLSRGLINRVKITDMNGYDGHYYGDVVPYDSLVRDYAPRKGFEVSQPKRSIGKFLESPILHYTIGTKITPSVSKNLIKGKIGSIIVHKDKPIFEPIMPRIMEASSTDLDWKVRLGGFNLKKSFLDSATKGSTSITGDTSYIPSVIEGSPLYSKYKGDNNG